MFADSEHFLNLMVRLSARRTQVAARSYGNGAWYQYSGTDVVAHIGRSALQWEKIHQSLGLTKRSLLYLGKASYSGFVSCLGAICAGFDVMFLPPQTSKSDLLWCMDHFLCQVLFTDSSEFVPHLKSAGLPVYNVGDAVWIPRDKHPEPPIFSLFRKWKNDEEGQSDILQAKSKSEFGAPSSEEVCLGKLNFVSFGNDGFQKPERLSIDAIVQTAQNFVLHVQAPAALVWKSLEMLAFANPFSHLSKFAVWQKNGVVGFPSAASDWETNLRILRPTVIFASTAEVEMVVSFVEEVEKRNGLKGHFAAGLQRLAFGEKLESLRELLASSRALKLPEKVFDGAGQFLRVVSRQVVGRKFVEEALGELKFIVHGLAPARESHVKVLGRLGVPVVETYGVTAAAGMLAANTFDAPHLNLIGSPLPHVSFRLGAHSLLEYKLALSSFAFRNVWQETGDVAQMTPFGFAITGRKKHLVTTTGGVTVSPMQLEMGICDNKIVREACIVGDKLPYLTVLIVLTPEALQDYRVDPQGVKENVQLLVNAVNESQSRNATIKKFAIMEKPFNEADGERLPTGVLNRLKIFETRKAEIELLYPK